jgi:hypothetical protein
VKGGKSWARFEVAIDEAAATAAAIPEGGKGALKTSADVKKEAAELTAKVSPWAFLLPEYKAKTLATKMEDVLKPLAPPTPAAAPGGDEQMPPPSPIAPAPTPSPSPAPPAAAPPPQPPLPPPPGA